MSDTHQWLVRTSGNLIAGPYSQKEIRNLILEKKITQQDEVCEANSYWFTLHERDEVAKHFGVEAAVRASETDEVTQTTQTETQTSQSDLPTEATERESTEGPVPELPNIQELRQAGYGNEPLRNRALLYFQKQKKNIPTLHQPEILGSIEKPHFWKFVAWLLLFGVLIFFFILLKSLQS